MDLVITNVPFGQTYLTDDKYDNNYAIHDYFIKKSLDLVHEGAMLLLSRVLLRWINKTIALERN